MRFAPVCLAILCAGWCSPAAAAIDIHFYSKDFASTFPHAYVRLTGTVDATGEVVDTNYGFTPVRLNPSILMGPVKGMIQTVKPDYVARSDKHFTLRLTDAEYQAVLARVDQWRTATQPNYRLNSRNCVYFVADMAAALGLEAPPVPALMKKPKSFLMKVTADNRARIAQWPGGSVAQAAASVPATSR
ncbi:hypothetical protein H9L13_00750 [Sphingomonas lutea]|uniref:DUF4105 domain-containing protein n=1 Tax=Sphingomonas lutea TaxID=1045317 RepID=A0A7G9SI54_9SPHN|nr:hypothetical protein [Sphingomonas lutea]QNN67529.1 hypothetical protein H9L13_00750 [Sphingomonas lutea]